MPRFGIQRGSQHQTKIVNALTRLIQVGLGYIQIGQRLSTLSGGERQRLKLAAELERSGGIYVFDEPRSAYGRCRAPARAVYLTRRSRKNSDNRRA
ncbi:ATP-binding cassette domain-containing protein [Shewanella algae]|uniref:ATP-binding cassette domain-containing protein n=1 Tax=Shewanella algae TaxID=38313 RepID=UPI001184426D|nr:ATP-binding cassette domain-containing protein [Shewanella algae]MBO2685842.1 ATP-binding cassette domain-containing protein [Shewanella algae]